MKTGRASQTAELVCMGRALAHATGASARFSDPTALALLSPHARVTVERVQSKAADGTLRERLASVYHRRQASVMVARTVAIDDAVRDAAAPQVVILGAGLDGRAWRMPELANTLVFEVDDPDTQREKRSRISGLTQTARDVRFVPVNFERDLLDQALANAGHDATKRTTWVWEGVVMYLAKADVDANLAVIARRSSPGSRLIIVYHSPALLLGLVGVFVRRIGEPLRSTFSVADMRELLAKHGFALRSDQDLGTVGATISPEVARATQVMKHMRIAIADSVDVTRARCETPI